MHHLLVVDDRADICEVLKQGFEGGGNYRVRCATNRDDAFTALRGERVDLALLDMLMRDNASPEIEALAGELRVPVLRMSGHPDMLRRSYEQRIPALAKPFRISDLIGKMDRLLGEAEGLRRAMAQNLRTGRQLRSRSEADVAALRLSWQELSLKWDDICRQVLRAENED